jgi:hypothetical protein
MTQPLAPDDRYMSVGVSTLAIGRSMFAEALDYLHPTVAEKVRQLQADGGAAGIELLIDKDSRYRLAVVGVTKSGERRHLAPLMRTGSWTGDDAKAKAI